MNGHKPDISKNIQDIAKTLPREKSVTLNITFRNEKNSTARNY